MPVVRALRRLADGVLLGLAVASVGGALVAHLLPAIGHDLVVIKGASMEPTIPIGSLLVLEPVAAENLRPGDVVSVRAAADRTVVTHRIVRVVDRQGQPWLELRGDANGDPDPSLVPASAVVGRAALVLAGLGRGLAVFGTPSSVLVLAGVAGLLYALSLVLRAADARPGAVVARHPGAVP